MACNEQVGRRSRDDAFKDLLMKLSHNMSQENTQELAVLGGLQLSAVSGAPTIRVLQLLREEGAFSPMSCAKLHSFMGRIYRCDLADLVGQYMDAYTTSDLPTERHMYKPEEDYETGNGKIVSTVIPLQRIASGPTHLATLHEDENRHTEMVGGEVEVERKQEMEEQYTKPRRAFSYDQLEHGSFPDVSMKSQASFSSLPSQPRLAQGPAHGSLELQHSSPSVAVSGESLHSASSLQGSQVPTQITLNIGNSNTSVDIHIASSLSDHSASLSPPITSTKGVARPTDCNTITSCPPTQRKNSKQTSCALRNCRSSSKESSPQEERMSGMFSTLHEVDEQSDDKKEANIDTIPGPARHAAIATTTTIATQSPKHDDKPRLSGQHKGKRSGAQSFAESPKQGCKWKLFGGGSRAKRSRELIKHCTWVVEQSLLSRYIWDHKLRQKYIKCAYKVAVDIGCGSLNPYLSLHLYPFGLFRDEGTSVTLQIKVNIPDDCPPIPVTANFSLLWDICMRETTKGKLLAGSKKPTKIPFDKGMVYTHKFFPHSIIKQCSCEAFEIHIYTSYLCQEVHTASDAVVPESVRGTPKHVLPGDIPTLSKLLHFKMASGEVLNIAQEIGEDYQRFGHFLLNDNTGSVRKRIAHISNGDTTAINQTLLSQWVQGKGRRPVQWTILIDTLRRVEMTKLANKIEQDLQLNITE